MNRDPEISSGPSPPEAGTIDLSHWATCARSPGPCSRRDEEKRLRRGREGEGSSPERPPGASCHLASPACPSSGRVVGLLRRYQTGTYAVGSNRRNLRRKGNVNVGQSAETRPVGSWYQLRHP